MTWVAGLPPGSFSVVMATGILSVVIRRDGIGPLSVALLVLAAAAYAVLVVLLGWQAVSHPRRVLGELADPHTSFDLLTVVAATAVLGTRLGQQGWSGVALGLWVAALVLLVVLGTAVAVVLTVGPAEDAGEWATGSWLLSVVAVQSVAVLGGVLAAQRPAHLPLVVALCAWLVGLSLYVLVITAIATRLLHQRVPLAEVTPDYWITMGALAISALAGTGLLAHGMHDPTVASIEPLIRGLTLGAWACGTAWIPWIVVTQVARVLRVPGAVAYGTGWWAMVFPLGMYAAATGEVGRVLGLQALDGLGAPLSWVALAAWVTVAAGLLRHGVAALGGS